MDDNQNDVMVSQEVKTSEAENGNTITLDESGNLRIKYVGPINSGRDFIQTVKDSVKIELTAVGANVLLNEVNNFKDGFTEGIECVVNKRYINMDNKDSEQDPKVNEEVVPQTTDPEIKDDAKSTLDETTPSEKEVTS